MSLDNAPLDLEMRRLAKVLHVEVSTLAGLEAIGVVDLRVLREQVTAKLFGEGTESWERAVAVSGVVPAKLAAKLTEGALGPVLAARVTAHTPPAKANDIGSKLSPSFLAEIAVHVDPRHITELVGTFPPDLVAEIGRELAARGEFLVMADFVATIPGPALATTVQALPEDALLQIAVLIEDPERISAVVALLPDDRLARLHMVATEQGLDEHLAHIVDSVDSVQRGRLDAG